MLRRAAFRALRESARARHVITRQFVRNLSASRNEENRKSDVYDRERLERLRQERQKRERAEEIARWATSWMMPWERAQMDGVCRPLKLWERVYWRLFIVFGGVGFAYETYVMGNFNLTWLGFSFGTSAPGAMSSEAYSGQERGAEIKEKELYRCNSALRTHTMLSDEELAALTAHQTSRTQT